MINLKTAEEIKLMREGGKIASEVLHKVISKVKPGVTTLKLEEYADGLIEQAGAKASFKMEQGYHWATCMCVNDCVVHGIPIKYKLVDGDKLCIDLGVFYKGWHADTAWTVSVGKPNEVINSFLKTGQKALEESLKQCAVGNHIGDISTTMQRIVEGAGYSCVKQLVGHGVGRLLHEDPEVPCYLRGRIKNSPQLKEGTVIAVEVIYNMGTSPVVYKNSDGWTIVTRDGLPSAVFEHTVAVTKDGPLVLTA